MNPPPVPPSPDQNHSGLATASMICGFLAIPTCMTTALPAIILGHIAWSKAGVEGGNRSRAKLGLIFGYGSFALIPVIAMLAGLAAPLVIRQRNKANQAECMNHVRQIGLALNSYQEDHGAFPQDLRKLETEGVIHDLDDLLSVHTVTADDWLYFPKAKTSDSKAPLLISPPIDKKRVELRVDLSVTLETYSGLPESTETGETAPVRIPVPLHKAR